MDTINLGKVRLIIERFGMQEAEIRHGEYHVHTSKLFKHVFIQGTTNSGKTELLKSIIQQLIKQGIRVCVIDGKGSPKFAQDVCVMAHEAKVGPVPVFRYGTPGVSTVFHGFTGDNQSVYNRLVSLLGQEDTGGPDDFYKRKRRLLLLHVCGVNIQGRYAQIAPFEPPRSFQELAGRLTATEWRTRFRASSEAMAVLENNIDTLEECNGLVWATVTPYIDILGSHGFKLGDHPVSMFSINAKRGGFQSEYFIKYLTEALNEAMGNVEMVCIFDEIGMFGGEGVVGFTLGGREFKLGMVMALQSTASLGEKKHIEEILDTTPTKIIMKNDEAAELRRRAGTQIETDRRKTFDKDGRSKGRSEGDREEDKISQEDVQNLLPGEMFVVNGGSVYKVKSEMIKLKTPFHPSMQLIIHPPPQEPPQLSSQRPKNPGPNPF